MSNKSTTSETNFPAKLGWVLKKGFFCFFFGLGLFPAYVSLKECGYGQQNQKEEADLCKSLTD